MLTPLKLAIFSFTWVVFTCVGVAFVETELPVQHHHVQSTDTIQKRPTCKDSVQTGDLIFQTSRSAQSKSIQLATKSRYSHCGIIQKIRGKSYVLEAVQPVKVTPLDSWIARGEDGHFVIKRLKNAEQVLDVQTVKNMHVEMEKVKGKHYDLAFEWSDDKLYCSELIWKIYKSTTGLELGKLQKLGDFDLSDMQVRAKLTERYGTNIPLHQPVISPQSIFASPLLETCCME